MRKKIELERKELPMRALLRFRTDWSKVLVLAVVSLCGVNLSGQEARRAVVQPTPAYPEMAKQFRLSGTVKVQVVIAPDGQIKETKVIGGHPLLAEAALNALKKWKFAPSNAETTQVLEFNFRP